jgi:hypothetical protein
MPENLQHLQNKRTERGDDDSGEGTRRGLIKHLKSKMCKFNFSFSSLFIFIHPCLA